MNRGRFYSFGPYVLDAEGTVLTAGGTIVPLPPKALKTLLTLVEHNGSVVSKQELIEAVWPDSFVEEGNLTQSVFLLRRELGIPPSGDEYIQTLPKRGYRFAVSVQIVGLDNEQPVSGPSATLTAALAALPPPAAAKPKNRGSSIRAILARASIFLALAILAFSLEWYRETPRPPSVSGFTRITRDGEIKRAQMAQVGGPQASLFSDGARIYFNEGSSDAPLIMQVSAQGGDTDRLPMPSLLPSLLDLSLPRSEMLVAGSVGPADAPPLWVVPLPAGPAHVLNGVTAWDAAWSADGRLLAYVRGRELFLANGDGGGSRRLTVLPGNGWHPRWSPDGKLIRLTVFDIPSARDSLWEIRSDGTELQHLLSDWRPNETIDRGPVDICCGTWSPDGRDFVFQVSQGGRTDIWWLPGEDGWMRRRLGAPTAKPFRITSGQLSSLAPAFSPDGRKLFVIGQELRGELQKFDPRVGQFVSYLGGLSADFVDFSRDGNWLLYVAYPESTLWRSRTDGTERRQLTFPPLQSTVSRWSPDGHKILTFSIGGGDGQGALLLPAAGGKPRPVSLTRGEMQPSWSPDGSSIMYSDFPFFSEQPAKVSVHIHKLATNEVETLPGSEGLFAPQWSPDGKHAAALVLNGRRLVLFDFQTQTWTELAQGFGLLHWSIDSQWVYYMRYLPSPAIMRVRIADRHVEAVASLKGIRLAGPLAGLEFSVTPGGEPIITRDVGTQEVYSMDWSHR